MRLMFKIDNIDCMFNVVTIRNIINTIWKAMVGEDDLLSPFFLYKTAIDV